MTQALITEPKGQGASNLGADTDLGARLVKQGLLTPEQCEAARRYADQVDSDLMQAILDLNLVSTPSLYALAFDRLLTEARTEAVPAVAEAGPEAAATSPDELVGAMLVRHRLISDEQLLAAQRYKGTHRIDLCQAILELNLLPIDWVRALAFGRLAVLTEALEAGKDAAFPKPVLPDRAKLERDIRAELKEVAVSAAPSDLFQQVLARAFDSRATDIHIDPQPGEFRVRYRIDGQLQDVLLLGEQTGHALVGHIKVASSLNFVERRHSQDGRLTIPDPVRARTLRISTLPTVLGEKVVLRIHEALNVTLDLDQLGLQPAQASQLDQLASRAYGMVLVAGPVGSGKTTTLFSCISRVNDPRLNVVTIEDPIEYRLAGANQVQIDAKSGLTFADGLRAILRQDPNILMIGEIRDIETAQIGIRAALTGVHVFSTIHAADAASTIPALFNFGIPGYTLATGLNGIISQRLVRTICPYCREPREPTDAERKSLRALGCPEEKVASARLHKGKGCRACLETGYLGRTGVFEVLEINDTFRELVLIQSTKDVYRQVAMDEGMKSMREVGLDHVLDGTTTLSEVLRLGL